MSTTKELLATHKNSESPREKAEIELQLWQTLPPAEKERYSRCATWVHKTFEISVRAVTSTTIVDMMSLSA